MANRKRKLLAKMTAAVLCASAFTGILAACGSTPGEETDEVNYYNLDQVTLTDEYAVNGLDKEIDYLLKLDKDRLLANFYVNAGLKANATPYAGGWENALIGGHTLGHYLTALAQAYANAGTDKDDRTAIKSKLDGIIDELKTCQDNSKGEAGFLWGAKSLGSDVEIQFDNVEMGRTNIATQAWVPWYTMHKIIAGLIDVYNLTGNKTAKTVVENLGDWVYNRVSKWSKQTQTTVLNIEYGGMNDCMYNLYEMTGKDKYAVAAHMFDEESLFNAISANGNNYLNNRHANTTIPKIIGALNRYVTVHGKKINGETVDASDMVDVAKKFWTRVVEHHTYVTGGNSEWEHFGMDDVLDGERTNANCETCNTYNMLKLSRMLFSITKDVKYLDY